MSVTHIGTYILVLKLDSTHTLTIGRSGTFEFAAGWYTYVGSAFGPGGLRGRLNHHLTPVTRPHWHIDYLRQVAVIEQVWVQSGTTSHEHDWAYVLQCLPEASIPAPRFGASDCRCHTHLCWFAYPPVLHTFPDALQPWPVRLASHADHTLADQQP